MRNFHSNSISFHLFIFIFFFFLITTTKSTDLINKTCKKKSTQFPNLNYNFCSISPNFPLNHTINDLKELAILAMNLTLSINTDVISSIQELINGGDQDHFDECGIGCLNDCLELYTDSIFTIQDSIEAFLDGKYVDAILIISGVMESCVTCGEGFSEKDGGVNPLTEVNYRFVYQLADISVCLINLVHSHSSSFSQSS